MYVYSNNEIPVCSCSWMELKAHLEGNQLQWLSFVHMMLKVLDQLKVNLSQQQM